MRRELETRPINENVFIIKSIKRELWTRPIYDCRCDERLKPKDDESTCLAYTGLLDECWCDERPKPSAVQLNKKKFLALARYLLGCAFCLAAAPQNPNALACTSGAGLAGNSRRWTSEGVPTDGSNICAWSW